MSTELAKRVICVYIQDMFLQELYGAHEPKIFLVTFGLASLYKTTCCGQEWNKK